MLFALLSSACCHLLFTAWPKTHQPSGTTSTTDHAGATFRSDNFGGGVDYTLGENASWENPSGMGKPVAPPRRTRSKKGSESEASFIQSADWMGQVSGMADFGADFGQAFASNPEATPMKAPPRRSRSKKGSEPESAAGKQASTVPESGQGLFDFGADFADAFPPQVPEGTPFQNSGAAADAFDFGADFTDAFPPHMPDETTATGGSPSAFGLGADFADALPPHVPEGNLQAAEKSTTEFDFGSDFTSAFSLQAPENTNQPFSTDPQNSTATGISFGDDPFKATGSTATTTAEVINGSAGSPDFGTAFSDPFPDLNPALGSGDNIFNSQSTSDQFANVDFSNSFSPPDPTLAVHGTAAFPAQPTPSSGGQDRTTTPQLQAFSEDATDPSSRSQIPTVQSDFAASVSTSQIPSANNNQTSNLAAVFSDSALATMGPGKPEGITPGKTGAGLSAPQQARKATSSGSLFDLDFVGLMLTASPVPFNKSLENVRPLDTGSPVNVGSPVPAKFYMSENSMSASSSSAELTALADMNQPPTAELTDLAPQQENPSQVFAAGGKNPSEPSPNPFATGGENSTKASPNPFASGGENLTEGSPNLFATGGENSSKIFPSPFAADRENPSQPTPNPIAAGAGSMDPFADLFNDHADTTTSVSFALDPLQSATESVGGSSPFLLIGADGGSEPTELPPPLPPKASLEIPPDVPPRTTSLHAPESEQGETTAESDEPGHKTLKKPEIAMVIAPYTASGNGQLSLEAGNLINVRQKSPRGWWEGELQARGQRKKIGWFPANYVKLLGSSSARSTPDPNATLSAGGSQHSGGSRSSTPQPQPTTAAPPLPTPQGKLVYDF
ncbi:hypothetical protein V1264_016080 [Littorina saxatilis]|uniref:SH3 domain-containing protein n=1 Tax=Littorina saxatilis TaxID=31220 RepID=A0AAN9BL64_9CAEN